MTRQERHHPITPSGRGIDSCHETRLMSTVRFHQRAGNAMTVDSKYTDDILAALRRDGPLTASQISETVGISRQGAYYWLRNEGAALVRQVGEGRNRAAAFAARDDAEERAKLKPRETWVVRPGPSPAVDLGATFTVVGLRIEDDVKVADLKTADGEVLTLHLD